MPIVVTPGAIPTAAELEAAKRLAELSKTTLPRTRAVAEKWRNGLATLIGLIGSATVVKGRESLDDLNGDAKVWVGVLMGGALVVGFIAFGFAMLASFGWPKSTTVHDIDDLIDWDTAEARRSATQLARSMVGTIAFVVLLVAALGVAWYSPGAAPKVQIVRADGTSVCGKNVKRDGDRLLIEAEFKTEVVLDELAGVAPVASCP